MSGRGKERKRRKESVRLKRVLLRAVVAGRWEERALVVSGCRLVVSQQRVHEC